MKIRVHVMNFEGEELRTYTFDYTDPVQRRTFAKQAMNAWKAGQSIETYREHFNA